MKNKQIKNWGKHNMDKVVIDLYKKKLYTDETFKKFVRVGWITPEQFKETTGKDYEPQVK